LFSTYPWHGELIEKIRSSRSLNLLENGPSIKRLRKGENLTLIYILLKKTGWSTNLEITKFILE